MTKREVYVSIDIETDGHTPGLNSMLSLGAYAFSVDAHADAEIGRFYGTLYPLDGARPDAETMDWWKGEPEAWVEVQKGRREPRDVIPEFAAWVDTLAAEFQPVPVFWPSTFDSPFVNYYLARFVGRNPFPRFRGVDVPSYVMGVTGLEYGRVKSDKVRAKWPSNHPHTHNALEDAVEQGKTFAAVVRDRRLWTTVSIDPPTPDVIDADYEVKK